MRFLDISFSRDKRFALGKDTKTDGFYLSIPVTNNLVDYEEYYAIGRQDFERFLGDEAAADRFAGQCRRREMDHLRILKPGSRRGSPA